jgi:hypothetical protein
MSGAVSNPKPPPSPPLKNSNTDMAKARKPDGGFTLEPLDEKPKDNECPCPFLGPAKGGG